MADFIKTISNGLNLFGIDRPNLWGSFLWGQNWGYGNNDLVVSVIKLIDWGSLSLSDATATEVDFIKTFSLALSVSGDMGAERISDNAGYFTVFQVSTNAEDRPNTSYNQSSSQAVSFTTVINTTTSWTEL